MVVGDVDLELAAVGKDRADARRKRPASVIFLSMVVPCGFLLLSCG